MGSKRKRRLRSLYSIFNDSLTLHEVHVLATYMYSDRCLNKAEFDKIKSRMSTRTTAFKGLFRLMFIRGDIAIEGLASALRSIGRKDLADRLHPKEHVHWQWMAVDDTTVDNLPGQHSSEILDLSANRHFQIGHSLGGFTKVRKLNLSRRALSEIIEETRKHSEVEELILDMTDVSADLSAILRLLVHLKKISLAGCRIVNLPDNIGDFEQLEELTLCRNNFSAGLNAAIGCLAKLKKLSLDDCGIVNLPDSIAGLQQLEEFSLCYNNFSAGLNAAIGRLVHLKKLCLHDCNIDTLPDSIGDLEQLEELYLNYNNFSGGLNSAIGRLLRLKKLYLDHCGVVSLPDSIGDLEQLEELKLNGNDFSGSLNSAIGRLQRLKKLELKFCGIAVLPDSIGDLEQAMTTFLELTQALNFWLARRSSQESFGTYFFYSSHYSR